MTDNIVERIKRGAYTDTEEMLREAAIEIVRLGHVLDEKIEQITDCEGHLKQIKEIAGVDRAIQRGALQANANLHDTITALQSERCATNDRLHEALLKVAALQSERDRLREALAEIEKMGGAYEDAYQEVGRLRSIARAALAGKD
jgi:hypothetical protein